ncbi:MAG: RagB/SusD family nutrient uptake outer membrane protein [Flavobacteriaceae bacterium]
MKFFNNIYIGCSVSILLLTLFSCSDDFLEETPTAILTEANFYQTEADAISATNAIYASIQSGNSGWYGNIVMAMTDITTDDSYTDFTVGNQAWQGWSRLNITSQSAFVPAVWNHHYRTIARTNAVIDNVSESLEIRGRLVAEAKFFRGLAYFDLVRLFGDVPVITSVVKDLDEAFLIASDRRPSVEVYELIESDLLAAEQVLPPIWAGADAGRATSGAAKGLLAKVYLTWAGNPLNDTSKYQLAANKAKEVIDGRGTYGYDLEDNYIDAFRNDLSKESLIEIQMRAGLGVQRGGSLLGIATFKRSVSGILGANYRGNALVRPTPDLVNAYDPSDLRLVDNALFTSISNTSGDTATFDAHYFKWIDVDLLHQGLVLNDGEVNTKVLRFSDVLLIYAEALNELGTPTQAAYDAINEVRTRAGLVDLSSLDQSSFREAVYLERRLELCNEFNRWFDLVRWGRYISTMQAFNDTEADFPNPQTTSVFAIEKNIKSHYILWPIPQEQIDILETDVNIQNPGY